MYGFILCWDNYIVSAISIIIYYVGYYLDYIVDKNIIQIFEFILLINCYFLIFNKIINILIKFTNY